MEYYHSVNLSPAKLYLLKKLAQTKLSRRSKNIRDYLDLKGLMIGGVDTVLYSDYFKAMLGIEPFCIYGVTELGLPMFGSPDHKNQLLPNLRSCYFEFLNEKHELVGLKDVKVGETYEVVLTAFGGLFVRYTPGDMVRVVDFRDDGMPIFCFWGRKDATILIGYRLVTEAVATQVMARAGLSLSDKWAFTKSFEGREKLLVLMENTWGISEDEAAKRIFEALYSLVYCFREYVEEFPIKDPSELIKVEYLKKGAFTRYSMKKAGQGFPMGQIKPPKIIPPERQEITDLLRVI